MALLWDRTKTLTPEQFQPVRAVYAQRFPPDIPFLEARVHLTPWIEENFFHVKTGDTENQVFVAQELFNQLEQKVEQLGMCMDPQSAATREKLVVVGTGLRNKCAANMQQLFATVHDCLQQELNIVNQCLDPKVEQAQVRQKIALLKQKNVETEDTMRACKSDMESLTSDFYQFREYEQRWVRYTQEKGEADPEAKKGKVQVEKLRQSVAQKHQALANRRGELVTVLVENFKQVQELQAHVLDKELIDWKREQQLSGNGKTMSLSLEVLQEWCEGLAQVLWEMRTQTKQLIQDKEQLADSNQATTALPELLKGVTGLLSNLVTGTFIIEKQPPQVMKTHTRFTATVRLLVGGQLQVHMASPSVCVNIVSETQAAQLLNSTAHGSGKREEFTSGEILNGQGNMEYHAATRQVSVTFRNLQLKRIKRTEKKGTESVMEEKFSVYFWTEFQIGELKFQVWTLSLPVVVIVHGNQEPQALATITWDNAFAEWGRPPFRVPDKVPWLKMAEALNMKWQSQCSTTRSLTQENLYYLASKIFRSPKIAPEELAGLHVSWSQFCREPLPDRNFTFWEWFYRVMNLTSNHMRGPWAEGYVMGFVSKQRADELLKSKDHGCFLLRFSDSELGGVTIAYVRVDTQQGKNVFNVAPFTTKDLSQRSIGDTIFDLKEHLTFVFPNIPKAAFKKFSAHPVAPQPRDGYVPHQLRTHVQGHAPIDAPGYGATSEQPFANPQSPPQFQFPAFQEQAYTGAYQEQGFDNYDTSTINISDIGDIGDLLGIATQFGAGSYNAAGNMETN